jgi:hypothetical protein
VNKKLSINISESKKEEEKGDVFKTLKGRTKSFNFSALKDSAEASYFFYQSNFRIVV